MLPTVQELSFIGGKLYTDNQNSLINALSIYGRRAGLDLPHRLAHYFAQIAHESGGFKYDQEIASGRAYEGRKDLGNIHPGDGVKFKGRTPGQITGRANAVLYRDWCKSKGLNPPDFEEHPELMNTDPWEGLGPIWFWETHNLNDYADKNDIEMITHIWNGGLNGFDDRLKFYTRSALVFLGRPPDAITGFQLWAQEQKLLPADTDKVKQADGVAGPKTRAALHTALVRLSSAESPVVLDTAPAPVVVTEPVVPKGAEAPGIMRALGGLSLAGVGSFFTGLPDPLKYGAAVLVVLLIIAMLWRGEQITMRAKKILAGLF